MAKNLSGTIWRTIALALLASLQAHGMDLPESDFSEASPTRQERSRCRDSSCASARAEAAGLTADGTRESRAGRHSEAIVLLEKASRLDPSSAETFFSLGDAYHLRALSKGGEKPDLEASKAAVAAYQKAMSLDPRLTSLAEPFSFYAALEECQSAIGDNASALKANMRTIEVSRKNFMPRLQRAAIHFDRQEWSQSSVALYRSIRAARLVKMYPQLSRLVREAPRYAALLDLPQNKIIMDSYDAVQQGDLTEAEAEEQVRDYVDFALAAKQEAADEAASQQVASTKEPAPATAASAQAASSGQASAAGETVLFAAVDHADGELRDSLNDPSLAKRQENPDSPAEAVAGHIAKGDEAYAAGRLADAILSYESALTLDVMRHGIPIAEEGRLFERVGSAYRRLGMFKESLKALSKALDGPNKRASVYYELSLYCAQTMDLDRSIAFLDKALKTAGAGPEAWTMVQDARKNTAFDSLRRSRAKGFSGLLARPGRKS